MPNDDPQEQLLQRARAGNAAALTVLLARSSPRIRARMGRRIPPGMRAAIDADDILQETLVQAFRHIHRFTPQAPDGFDRWLATIAMRCLRTAIRRQRALKRGGNLDRVDNQHANEASAARLLDLLAAPGETPSRCAGGLEAHTALHDAVERLPEDYRLAVRLVYLEGRTVQETARRLDRSERAVHNLCHKAKRKLRELLGSGSRFFLTRS